MSTPGVQRPDALKVLDDASKGGQDSVSPHVRAAAAVNTPESNEMIKNMTSSTDAKTMIAFAGAKDCSVADGSKESADANKDALAKANQSHMVTGERRPESTVGNDTRYSVAATAPDSASAKLLANSQAAQVEAV